MGNDQRRLEPSEVAGGRMEAGWVPFGGGLVGHSEEFRAVEAEVMSEEAEHMPPGHLAQRPEAVMRGRIERAQLEEWLKALGAMRKAAYMIANDWQQGANILLP